jgi:hypothetical protein
MNENILAQKDANLLSVNFSFFWSVVPRWAVMTWRTWNCFSRSLFAEKAGRTGRALVRRHSTRMFSVGVVCARLDCGSHSVRITVIARRAWSCADVTGSTVDGIVRCSVEWVKFDQSSRGIVRELNVDMITILWIGRVCSTVTKESVHARTLN